MNRLKYRDFADRIDVDAFEEAIGFEPLETHQGEDKGYCPNPWNLHNNGDTTGKFAIHREKRVFNCWVCDGGTLLSLTMALRDCCEQDAIDWLYQFTAPPQESNEDFLSEIEGLLAIDQRKEAVLPYFNEHVLNRYDTESEELEAWLDERGISPGVADRFKVCFDPFHKRKSTKGEYLGPAVILPHFWNDRLVGWQERWLGDRPKWLPKYTNTQDFPRSETIYNYEGVYLATDPIVVCESVPTVLYLTSLGVPAVATFGSNVNPLQLRLLRGCHQGVILAPDNDGAGRKYLRTLAEYLEQFISVSYIEAIGVWNSGSDLGDVPSGHLAAALGRALPSSTLPPEGEE